MSPLREYSTTSLETSSPRRRRFGARVRVDLNSSLLLAVLSLDFPALEFFDVGVFRFVFERFRRHPLRRWHLLANAPLSLPSAPVYSPRFLRVLPRRFLPPAARGAIGPVDPKLFGRRPKCPPSKKRDFDAPLCFQSAVHTSISSSSLQSVAPRVEASSPASSFSSPLLASRRVVLNFETMETHSRVCVCIS